MTMRWYFDTEFNEDGRIIELISIGLLGDDGTEYYAVSSDFDPDACNDWVKANVLKKLPPPSTWKPKRVIAEEIKALVQRHEKNQFWAYFADYDWVVLCQIFGCMIDLPKGFPMFCMDLKQLMVMAGVSKNELPPQSMNTEHNALEDAKWVKGAVLHLMSSESIGMNP